MSDRWKRPRSVTVCVDTPGWFDPFAARLVSLANDGGDNAILVDQAGDVVPGDIAFYLSCTSLTPGHVLARNTLNVVVHASALPHGRGFSPVAWQVLEGRNVIPVTMIEAVAEADAGDILMQSSFELEGHELNDEIRNRLGETIVEMCVRLLASDAPPVGTPQVGSPTWYSRRRPSDSRLDPSQSLAEQFNLLRVVDNERYPAYFDHLGHRYVVKIEKAEELKG